MSLADLVLLLTTFSLALVFSHLVARYAVALGLLDIPNDRSFHSLPVPRGGGLGVALAYLLALSYLHVTGHVNTSVYLGLGIAGLLLLVVGFIDDKNHIPARWRFLAQLMAVLFGLVIMDGLPDIQLFAWSIPVNWLIYPVLVVFALWWINLFNFMDGIDGIAAIQAVSMLLSAAVLVQFFSAGMANADATQIMLWTLLVSVLGFLLLNWSPASVFMGDAGSTFIAYALIWLALNCFAEGLLSLWVWLILGAAFLVDATYTLLRRMLDGQTWYEAHRSHAYQHAAQRVMDVELSNGQAERRARTLGHRKVCYGVALINLFWLLPMAALAQFYAGLAPLLLFVACLPLVILVRRFGAGKR